MLRINIGLSNCIIKEYLKVCHKLTNFATGSRGILGSVLWIIGYNLL